MDKHGDEMDHGDAMGLTALTEAAGVSVRTVRYYIAEGLLPPPVSAGPRAAYTAEHLDRLRLIARLKDAYLPLREIRRRLRGLDAAAVHALLEEDGAGAGPRLDVPPPRANQPGEDSAAAYLSRLLPARRERQIAPPPAPSAPMARSSRMTPFALDRAQPAPVGERTKSPEQESERPESPPPAVPGDPNDPTSLIRADLDRGAALAALDAFAGPEEIPAESWRRLRLGDGAELLIRADAYDRQRDQIDALVAWARRILG